MVAIWTFISKILYWLNKRTFHIFLSGEARDLVGIPKNCD